MQRIIRMTSLIVAGTVAVLLGVHSANAANLINWGAAQNITGDTDVSTLFTSFEAGAIGAVNIGNTVNTVLFENLTGNPTVDGTDGGNIISVNWTSFLGGIATPGLSGNYAQILSQIVYSGINGTQTITLSGLTVGHTYQIEYWANHPGTGDEAILSGVTPVTLQGDNSVSNTGSLGQFAIGTYVADATSVSFTYSATGGQVAIFDALQIREVPEPSTWVIGALAGVVLVWSQRRRWRKVA